MSSSCGSLAAPAEGRAAGGGRGAPVPFRSMGRRGVEARVCGGGTAGDASPPSSTVAAPDATAPSAAATGRTSGPAGGTAEGGGREAGSFLVVDGMPSPPGRRTAYTPRDAASTIAAIAVTTSPHREPDLREELACDLSQGGPVSSGPPGGPALGLGGGAAIIGEAASTASPAAANVSPELPDMRKIRSTERADSGGAKGASLDASSATV
jgi:hypothetical protein